MRARRVFHAVDSHTEGMPTRVVVGGMGAVPGETMRQRRDTFVATQDHLRRLLMYEPRGHAAMSGAILQSPTRADADVGVLFIEVSGCLPMCGHGTIGVATVLVETGTVAVTEPVTTVRLDTPAGLVVAEVAVRDGAATGVTFRNVPSYTVGLDRRVEVPGVGEVGYDLAYGGNFFAVVRAEDLGVSLDRVQDSGAPLDRAQDLGVSLDRAQDLRAPLDRVAAEELLRRGLALMAAVNAADEPVHPEQPTVRGCRHVQVLAPGSDARHTRNATVIHPGWLDRSPCGTGTSARMAQLHARGELDLHTDIINESLTGTRFVGRLVERTEVAGIPAVVPTVTGRAWVTGTGQYLLDDDDPFPEGFLL